MKKNITKFKNTEIGIIPEEWQVLNVKNLVSTNIIEKPIDGNHGSIHPKSSDYVDHGIPFIMASDLENGHVNYNNCKFISDNTANNLQKGFSKPGDVLISHKATIGRTALVDNSYQKIILTPQVTYYRVKKYSKLNNKYLKYYFDNSTFQNIFSQWAGGGSTRSYLGITKQLGLPIILPTLSEQEQIVEILSSLDDKIEINRQINSNLEKVASILFKQWFIDFDFPNTNGKPYETSGGKMVDSELGGIPEGWKTISLGECIKFEKGKKPRSTSEEKQDGFIPQILIETFDTGRSLFSDPIGTVIAEKKDVLMVMDGASSGRVEYGFFGAIGSTLAKISPQNLITESFLYHFLKSKEQNIKENTTGTSIPHTDKGKINNYMFAVSDNTLIDVFSNTTKLIMDQILINRTEIVNLAIIRDSLLPRLMTGKIRVKKYKIYD